MPRDPIHKPHDRMFHELFTRLDSAAGFLREVLPPAISKECSWDQIELKPGSWVDEEFSRFESDLLYQVPMQGAELQLYVLLEHQSTPDKWMSLRLLIYMGRIWQDIRKAGKSGGKLPPIIPLVVYQGARSWDVPKSLGELFALTPEARIGLEPFLPSFEFALFDLPRQPEIPGGLETQVVLGIMRAVMLGREAYLKALEEAGESMQAMMAQERTALLIEKLLRYVFAVDGNASSQDIQDAFDPVRQKQLKEKTMSIAEELMQQGAVRGREEGREEGLCIGLRRSTVRLLGIRFGDATGVERALAEISDSARLEELLTCAATADSLESFRTSLH